jgi:hypothetical protein
VAESAVAVVGYSDLSSYCKGKSCNAGVDLICTAEVQADFWPKLPGHTL